MFTNLLVSSVVNLQNFLTDTTVVKVSYNTLQKTRMTELYLSSNSGYEIDNLIFQLSQMAKLKM